VDLIGTPQIAALLVLAQPGLEELYSAKNTKALLAAGGREAGSAFYSVVAATHLAWIASLFFLIPPTPSSFGRSLSTISCCRSSVIG
jgi:methyltransferase